MDHPKFLSRGIDYLGDLGAKLRDLQGFRTLAHELIQNADDAQDTTFISFDVGDDALVVDNDGVFSDCQQIEEAECPWKENETKGHRCDFHRFRLIASGDKRSEAGTTGAFGIGFISVYQVTDCPELISAGRHWVLHENRPETERIEVCSGCLRCTSPDLPGTRFFLPWARDLDSEIRKALQAESVSLDGPKRMLEELERSLQIALLFLKRLRAIEIRQAGQPIHRFQRVDDNNRLILSDGNPENDSIWHIVRGDFTEAAYKLRQEHPGRIERKRSPKVTLAIPASSSRTGLLCACLPTEHNIGLPFHINADFFPTNDRKRVIFGDDYQSKWNREALRAAALAIGEAVGQLPTLLGAQHFWELVSTFKEVADRAAKEQGEQTLRNFWWAVQQKLRTAPVIYTTKGNWTTCAGAFLLQQREEAHAVPILEGLGMNIVHEDLRPYQSLLRSEAVGVQFFNIKALCDALSAYGMRLRIELNAVPSCLSTHSGRKALWSEIALLLGQKQHTPKAKMDDERRLREMALAPGRDDALWPCSEIFSADEATVTLFESLGVGIPFVSNDESFTPLISLCRPFNAIAAIDRLRNIESDQLERAWQEHRLPLRQLFEWFENRRQETIVDQATREKLAALPIFPSSRKLRSLDELALPGNFDDPLGLAELVDLAALGHRRGFLRDLGMPELDLRTYVVARLPAALRDMEVSAEKRRAAVKLLANRLGELRDDPDARRALASTPLVECTDGQFRPAHKCYFDVDAVQDCLGDAAHYALLPEQLGAAIRNLYAWLGVAKEPGLDDIVTIVRKLSDQPYSPAIAARIRTIIERLGERIKAGDDPENLQFLKSARWLPAQGKSDRWYSSNEVYAVYSAHLFQSQALFLDAPVNVQNGSRDFLKFLEVALTPPTSLVVKHLIHCATQQIPVNADIYRFLNDKTEDPALLHLKDKKCLWLGDAYRTPSQVFWGEHPFGRYRWRLGEEIRGYSKLLKLLAVRDVPDYQDALNVLRQISSEFGAGNTPLDADARAVLMACWQMLDKALNVSDELVNKLDKLGDIKCIPNADRILNPPEWMFFENRAGLARKFKGFLSNNVIPIPLGAANAFAAAGVRQLGSAVEIELLECANPADDPEMTHRMKARRNEIGRVLGAQAAGRDVAEALERLNGIRCEIVASLSIQHRLRAFNRELCSEPEQVPALYQREQEVLSFVRRDGNRPWAAIARELAIALFPDEDPGPFAAGLKEALAPESATEAAANLDELGFSYLDTTAREPALTTDAVDTLGTDGPASEVAPTPVAPPVMAPRDSHTLTPLGVVKRLLGEDVPSPTRPALGSNMGATGTEEEGEQGKYPEASKSPLGEDVPSPTPLALDSNAKQAGTERSGERGKYLETSKRKGRPVLRSYLPSPNVADSVPKDPDSGGNGESRSSVDLSGVRRVMEYETEQGRIPLEMPHKNPGYDIESRDESGNVLRYIEVKSFSGQWQDTYAVLSRPQFDKARDLADSFWLYVVERAESEDFEIYRIQNPALRANHFMFDDGWRSIAEIISFSEGCE